MLTRTVELINSSRFLLGDVNASRAKNRRLSMGPNAFFLFDYTIISGSAGKRNLSCPCTRIRASAFNLNFCTMTVNWLREKLYRDTAQAGFGQASAPGFGSDRNLLCAATAPALKPVCTWMAKTAPCIRSLQPLLPDMVIAKFDSSAFVRLSNVY